ncbi:FCD domain-containing protein [Streptomyces sp. NPDC058545]|uniref:GntR family transcriptional regulator n=1 Tax=Streptomyces sp. NPDC058545 TaxID=3346544 RepID=UPI00364CE73D
MHTPHVGYAVKRLTAEEFEQTYLMRRVLETEVIRAMPPLSEELLTRLTELNREIGRAGDRADYTTVHQLNVEFHFLIFQTSGLGLVVDELRRVWTRSGVYRSAYLAYDHDARCRIVGEQFPFVGTELSFHGSFWGNHLDLVEALSLSEAGLVKHNVTKVKLEDINENLDALGHDDVVGRKVIVFG